MNRKLLLLIVACVAVTSMPARNVAAQRTGAATADSLDPNMVPAGFGSLRQDDIAIKISPSPSLLIRAVPLDERLIRLLSPDSYRTLHQMQVDRAREIDAVKQRQRLDSYSLWYVSFYSTEQGETRFSPQEFIIQNVGRDFRPIDIIPMTTGFGEYRLKQRETQSAIYVFDGQLDTNQPLTAMMESTPSVTQWQNVMQRLDRERAMVRSRAAAVQKKDSVAK